jgi:hypothetical protein
MKVRCIRPLPDKEQARRLGKRYRRGKQEFGVDANDEFFAYGLTLQDGELWVHLRSQFNYLWLVPLMLFEIIDHSIPPQWEVHQSEGGCTFFGPTEMLAKFFHDDLLEGVPAAVEQFQRIRQFTEPGNR